MNIITYNPKSRFGSFFDSYDDLRIPSIFSYDCEHKIVSPKVHAYEDKNSLILKFDMPGLLKDDIAIDFTDKFLTISGSRPYSNIDKIANIHQEVDYGEFHRTLDLSNYHLKDDITAEYDNGILELVFSLSNVKHGKVRKIKIK